MNTTPNKTKAGEMDQRKDYTPTNDGMRDNDENKPINDSLIPNLLTRFVNFIVDLPVIFVLYVLLFNLFVNPFTESLSAKTVQILDLLVLVFSFFEYYGFMEYKYQKTIGKFLTKTKVVMIDGTKPHLKDIVIRTICRLIPIDPFFFLFPTHGLHDYLSKTTVITQMK